MIGPILVFLGVCAMVAVFMFIAHSFLRAAEEPEDWAPKERKREVDERAESGAKKSQHPQWAH